MLFTERIFSLYMFSAKSSYIKLLYLEIKSCRIPYFFQYLTYAGQNNNNKQLTECYLIYAQEYFRPEGAITMLTEVLQKRWKSLCQKEEAVAADAYLQWWYFDVNLDDGHRLLTFFLPRSAGRIEQHPEDQPFMDIALKRPGGEILREQQSFPLSEFVPRKGTFGANFGKECSATFENGTDTNKLGQYLLKAKTGRIAYDLRFTPDIPPWSPLGPKARIPRAAMMLARRSLFTKDYFHYAPFAPRGRVEGQIVVDDKPINVRGLGYHEQGRITFPLHEFAKAWYWLHIEHPPWTILSGTVIPLPLFSRSKPRTPGGFAFVQKGPRRLMALGDALGVHVKWSRFAHRAPVPDSEASMAWETTVKFRRPGLVLKVDVVSREILEHIPFNYYEKTPVQAYWGQTIAHARVRGLHGIKRVNFDTDCILETMVTGA